MVIFPHRSKQLLNDTNRMRAYVTISLVSSLICVADLIGRYINGFSKWMCSWGFSPTGVDSIISAILFFAVPVMAISLFYFRIGKILLKRTMDQDRNFDLTVSFAIICIVWAVTWGVKYILQAVSLLNNDFASSFRLTAIFWPYLDNVQVQTILDAMMITPFFNTFLSPFLIYSVNNKLRKPLLDGLKRFNWKWS